VEFGGGDSAGVVWRGMGRVGEVGEGVDYAAWAGAGVDCGISGVAAEAVPEVEGRGLGKDRSTLKT